MSSYKSFEEVDYWQKCQLVKNWINHFIKTKIPKNDFDMVQNIRRAGRSTTRNIAEGFGRFHFRENMQFCRISRGSLFEIKDDLLTCVEEKNVSKVDIEEGLLLINEAIYSV
ncbi:four helix bundle protein [Allomuricauda sp. d1]|uniref:four helix bundle protein n=1 Tax=Allomuricauda sp. d1 TaxID=3136725 RepID=UPI0031D2EA8E